MTSFSKRIRHFIEAHKTSVISFSPVFLLLGAPKMKTMEVAEMNKENGPTINLVPIINPPFADNKSLIFRHFSRYLCYPMLKLQRELMFLIDSRKR